MQSDKLRANVDAVNIANEYAMKVKLYLDEVFRPLVGKKIYKSDGSMLEKYKSIEKYPHDSRVKITRKRSDYFLAWNIQTSYSYGKSVAYYDVIVYVGKIEGQILTELYPVKNLRCDYTVEEIVESQRLIEEFDQKIRDIKCKIRDFL